MRENYITKCMIQTDLFEEALILKTLNVRFFTLREMTLDSSHLKSYTNKYFVPMRQTEALAKRSALAAFRLPLVTFTKALKKLKGDGAMITNKIVARYQDGHVMKGFTNDFMPNKELLHLLPADAQPDAKPLLVNVTELKAIFFVKDFHGDPQYKEIKDFDPKKPVSGRKIKVMFKDGELLVGTTQGYQPGRQGFFVFPADQMDNNERCYVITTATKTVQLI